MHGLIYFILTYIILLLKTILVWPLAFVFGLLLFRRNIAKLINEVSDLEYGSGKVKRRSKQSDTPEVLRKESADEGKENAKEVTLDPYKVVYLDGFLTNNSKAALKWFSLQEKTNLADFIKDFKLLDETNRKDEDEKVTIVQVLTDNNLLIRTVVNPNHIDIEIGPEGRKYLEIKGL